MTAAPSQSGLFDDLPIPADQLPDGLRLQEGFLSREEEAHLLDVVTSLPLAAARYKQYTARRQVISYGGSFDYDTNRLEPAQPLIEALHPLRDRVAAWADVPAESLVHVLVAAYPPGAPLGWHRDVPEFEQIFGVSLGGPATLRFRPYPPVSPRKEEVVRLQVEPRTVYAITGVARWGWQHSVAPVDAMRWSITFRTPRAGQRTR
jgi:alkylated DNA repair dioxygenase AlkB